MNTTRSWFIFTTTILLMCFNSFAQEDSKKKQYVSGAFATTQLINAQTTEMFPNNGFGFEIQHRFGAISADESIYKQFLGLDLPANIRFGFAYPISDRLYAQVGRTKTGKTVDLGAKFSAFKQTKDNSTPVSLALYFNTATMTEDFPNVDENTFFADSVTPFKYVFAHRLSYNSQVIISRKFNNTLSLLVSPTFVYHNLAKPGMENYTFALPISGRVKLGLTSSVLFEYTAILNNRAEDEHLDPISIAYEIGTAGHVFQIVLSTSSHLLEQSIYTEQPFDYREGELLLGFNIKRTFWSKKKR